MFHLGAISATTFNDADVMTDNNLNYSIALWRWCAAAGKPLIYASSAAMYGAGSAGFDDAGGIEPLKRLRPLNLYGWSKHAFGSVGNARGNGSCGSGSNSLVSSDLTNITEPT